MYEELDELAVVRELGDALVAGFRHREARRRWLPRWRPAARAGVLAAAAASGVGIVLATQLGGGSLSPAEAAAAQALHAAARVAAVQPVTRLGSGYYYVELRSDVLLPITRGSSVRLRRGESLRDHALVTFEVRRTFNPRLGGAIATSVVAVSFPTAAARARWVHLGRPDLARAIVASSRWMAIAPDRVVVAVGRSRALTMRQLQALPADVHRLYRRVFAGASATDAIEELVDISYLPLRPPLRAALYGALAMVPGIRSEGRVNSVAGRSGIALGAIDTHGAVEDEILIDPRNGQVLGSRTVSLGRRADGLPVGAVRAETVIVARRVTRTARPRA